MGSICVHHFFLIMAVVDAMVNFNLYHRGSSNHGCFVIVRVYHPGGIVMVLIVGTVICYFVRCFGSRREVGLVVQSHDWWGSVTGLHGD